MLEDAILSTDLAVYFKRRAETFQLLENSEDVDWSETRHRELLRGAMMTACDLAAITKPWETQKKVARLVSAEFFYQGDLEKKQLRIQPIDMMNREKINRLPAMQVDFIDSICLPVYRALAGVHENLRPMEAGCEANRVHWQGLAEEENSKEWNPEAIE